MNQRTTLDDVRKRLLAIETQLNATFVQRSEAIRVILLGVLSGSNYMFIGDPGTAKTSIIDRFTMHVETDKRFKILMGRFTQPDDVFGSLDIKKFKQGKREIVTEGMFTEAPFPILDETLKASDGCMNSLLGVLGPEREFRGRPTDVFAVGGATNWPEVEMLSKHVEALYDRFLLRCHVTAVDRSDKVLRRMMYRAAAKVRNYEPKTMVTADEIRLAHLDVLEVEISDQVIDMLDDVVNRLTSGHGNALSVQVSDRRSAALQIVLQVNAWLDRRDKVCIQDFDVLQHGLWNKRKDLETIRATLDTIDNAAVNEIITMAEVGHGAYVRLQSQGFGAHQVNEVTDQFNAIGTEVQERLKQPVYTNAGRAKIHRAMRSLKMDFDDLIAHAEAAAGKLDS